MTFKKTILIDLDGVLNEYDGNFDENIIPNIKKGAKDFLKTISKDYRLYLFTTRNKLLTSKWLIKNKIDNYFIDIISNKIPSYIYIDDRCINFNGNFNNLLSEINNFKVYWK